MAEAESSKIFLLGYLRGSDGVPTLDLFSGETMTMPTHGVLERQAESKNTGSSFNVEALLGSTTKAYSPV